MKQSRSLTHVDPDGVPGMVNVSAKAPSARMARAEARLVFPPEALAKLRENEWHTAKGAVFHTAVIAGTQAVKRTSDLIPFCHPLPVEGCIIQTRESSDGLLLSCEVSTTHKTGVEMEALTGVTVASLSVIDMCKALTPEIRITAIELVKKTGGKRDFTRS